MNIELNTTISHSKPQFKARFSQKDIKILMDSAKQKANLMQDMYVRGTQRMTGVTPEKAKLTEKVMYGRLNAILEHADKVKGKVLSLAEEKLPNGKKAFKVLNENNEILGLAENPITALENAFVMKGKNELAPMYWGHKSPNRVIEENMQKIGEISEKDVLAKALS